jgi:hypothetical protein
VEQQSSDQNDGGSRSPTTPLLYEPRPLRTRTLDAPNGGGFRFLSVILSLLAGVTDDRVQTLLTFWKDAHFELCT